MAVDMIDRSKLSGLIPEPVTREIIQGAVTESAVLRMARRLPNMTSKTQTLNVLDALPTAYFVNGEATTGAADSKASLKKTTNMAWDKKKIYAEEIAVIVPIPEAVLENVEIELKYEGYIKRQRADIEEARRLERKRLPRDVDYSQIKGLRLEAVEKLNKVRPENIGQAGRISGVSPADISVLLIWLSAKEREQREGGNP